MIPRTSQHPTCTACMEEINPDAFTGCDYSYSRGPELLCEGCFEEKIRQLLKNHRGMAELAEELGYKVESMYQPEDYQKGG